MKTLLIRAILPALLLCQLMVAQQKTGVTTVYLVRHAEKASTATDALLSPTGQQRAECLAHTLKDAGIKRIYVSDKQRTQQTAEPLAKALGIKPIVVPALDVNTMVRDIFYGTGGNALVVGHSDTLPLLVQRVQAGSIPPIGENEYDRLVVVNVMEGGSTPAVTLHYCAFSPSSAAPASMEPANKQKPKATKAPAKKP